MSLLVDSVNDAPGQDREESGQWAGDSDLSPDGTRTDHAYPLLAPKFPQVTFLRRKPFTSGDCPAPHQSYGTISCTQYNPERTDWFREREVEIFGR